MNQFNRPQPDPEMAKRLLKEYYQQNKLLIYIMLAITIALFALGQGIHSIFIFSILYLGGTLFKQYLGEQKMISTMIFGAISGAVVYAMLFLENSDPAQLGVALIDSAVFAVITAVATYAPNYEILFFRIQKIKLKYIAIGLALLALAMNSQETAYRFAAIGGMIYGFLSIYIKNQNPYRSRKFNFGNIFKRKPKGPHIKNKHKQEHKQTKQENDQQYNQRKKAEQDEIDKILDKVKLKGYESLSASEKQKLFDKSK
jgi:hypothetical protein